MEAGGSSDETAALRAPQGVKMPLSTEETAMAAPPVPLVSALGEVDDSGGDHQEEEDDTLEFWDGEAPGNGGVDVESAVLEFLGKPTPFATTQCTAGYMRLTAEEVEPGQDGGGGEIVVHYRRTPFWWGQGDVELKLYTARFLVPFPFPAAAADLTTSLRLAGASLASIAYPAGFYVELQALWASLVALAVAVRDDVPPRAARLVVTADVAILERRDRTPERMARMRGHLPELARSADADAMTPSPGMERRLRLPAPVCCDEEDQGGARPAKRKRKRGGEECGICYEALEGGQPRGVAPVLARLSWQVLGAAPCQAEALLPLVQNSTHRRGLKFVHDCEAMKSSYMYL
ncbi:hypothetical protein ACP70R_028605 [Stipagrostis hirtigluma subsp. patula]